MEVSVKYRLSMSIFICMHGMLNFSCNHGPPTCGGTGDDVGLGFQLDPIRAAFPACAK